MIFLYILVWNMWLMATEHAEKLTITWAKIFDFVSCFLCIKIQVKAL